MTHAHSHTCAPCDKSILRYNSDWTYPQSVMRNLQMKKKSNEKKNYELRSIIVQNEFVLWAFVYMRRTDDRRQQWEMQIDSCDDRSTVRERGSE